MLAEMLTAALRDHEEAANSHRCMREESFRDLYQVLGDREAQDAIRANSPRAKHCPFLLESPDACENLPERYHEKAGGAVCPNNPHGKPDLVRLFEAAEDDAELVEEAMLVRDMTRLHTLPPIERIDAGVFHAARIMAEWQRGKDIEMQARMSGLGGTEGEE